MAIVYPDFDTISHLHVEPTDGEYFILNELQNGLDSSYEIFFQPFLDCDRPDIIILKEGIGAFIIEVKDWALSNYEIHKDNTWKFKEKNNFEHIIKSPPAQVFHYKSKLYNVHIPILGIKNLSNKFYYNLIYPYIYYHCSSKSMLDNKYDYPLMQLKIDKNKVNEKYKLKNISYYEYEKKISYINISINKLTRDKNMSFTNDNISKLIDRIKYTTPKNLFDFDIYNEFKRRLLPPKCVGYQKKTFNLSGEQTKLVEDPRRKMKIKGVAGSGKTTVLAIKALKSLKENKNILILSYNISLKNLIHDKLSYFSHKYGGNHFKDIELSHYHQFIISMCNNLNIHVEFSDSHSLDRFVSNKNIFKGCDTSSFKYGTIFIDELQDYKIEWIKILENYFLEDGGKIYVFGDFSQNIYDRDENQYNLEHLKNFGYWQNLKEGMRSYSFLKNSIFIEFEKKYLIERHKDMLVSNKNIKEDQHIMPMAPSRFIYNTYSMEGLEESIRAALLIILDNNLHNNDIVILASNKDLLRSIEYFIQQMGELTLTSFATYNDIDDILNGNTLNHGDKESFNKKRSINKITTKDIKECPSLDELIYKLEKIKKYSFWQNSGVIKLSTIHSYKGFESENVFLFIDESDSPELVYTGLTRSIRNLYVFGTVGNKYEDFFKGIKNV